MPNKIFDDELQGEINTQVRKELTWLRIIVGILAVGFLWHSLILFFR